MSRDFRIPVVSCAAKDTGGTIAKMKKGPNIRGLTQKKEYESFARNMKYFREMNDWTFENAAEKYGVTKYQVQKYEWGLNLPKPFRLKKIAGIYGLTVEQLLGDVKIFDQSIEGGPGNNMGI